MAINSKQVSRGLGGIVLAALLSVSAVEARTGATGTPVPFPSQAPASLPTESELRATLANRQEFVARVDHIIRTVHNATERYREYIVDVKEMLASCEVESDTAGFENTGFENLVADGGRQCREWVAGFDQQARAYAAQLDEARTYQKLVQRVGERVLGQIDRIRLALHSSGVKDAVDEGMRELRDARDSVKPWMNSTTNNR